MFEIRKKRQEKRRSIWTIVMQRSKATREGPMTRKLIAALLAATIGLGFSAQAMAGDWSRDGRHYGYGWRDRNHDGRIDWRDKRHYRWDHGRHYGWRDHNRDGRFDWRDKRHHWWDHGRHYGWRDHNRDGRFDWRDRRYNRVDRNHDGRLDPRERSFARRDRNRDGHLSFREWAR
jgi:hypothetical protein